MTPIISHHVSFATPVLMEKPKIVRRADDLDECNGLVYFAATEDAIVQHQALDEVPGLTADTVEAQQLEDGVWELVVKGIGIASGKTARQMRGYPRPVKRADGWDGVEDAWLTTNPNLFAPGQAGSYGGSTFCLEVSSEELHGTWHRVRAQFAGLIVPKGIIRQISCNGNSYSSDSIKIDIPGGWNSFRKGEIELPNVVVQDTIYEAKPPPTNQAGRKVTPPGAPAINLVTFSGDDLTWHYPGDGWKFTCQGQQLASTGLWCNVYTYQYQLLKTP